MKKQYIITLSFLLLLVSCGSKINIDLTKPTVSGNPIITPTPNPQPQIHTPELTSADNYSTSTNIVISNTITTQHTDTVILKTQGSHGTFVLNNDLTFTYTPLTNYMGTDSIVLTLSNSDSSIDKTIDFTITGLTCPINYVKIDKDNANQTNEFCVMKFEAKNNSGIASSTPTGTPWTNITISQARSACQANGVGFDIISNKEWITIARKMEVQPLNWFNGVINASSTMIKGHSDGVPYNSLSVSNEANEYDQTSDTSSTNWNQRRTLYINATDKLWDFSGNVWEWVNWETDPSNVFNSNINNCSSSQYISLNMFETECPSASSVDLEGVLPLNPYGLTNYNGSKGLGDVFITDNASLGFAIRGGFFDDTPHVGLYSIAFDSGLNDLAWNIGFRCVLR